jgi:enamine deaminase RidA (YjgF/YER057c/UK114 family)
MCPFGQEIAMTPPSGLARGIGLAALLHPPARSAFGTSGLAMGARVELECMALGDAG